MNDFSYRVDIECILNIVYIFFSKDIYNFFIVFIVCISSIYCIDFRGDWDIFFDRCNVYFFLEVGCVVIFIYDVDDNFFICRE